MFSGKVTRYAGSLSLTNPDFQLLDDDPDIPGKDPEKLAAMPIPVYPATAKLTSWKIQKAIPTLLETLDLDNCTIPCRPTFGPGEVPAGRRGLPPHPRPRNAWGLATGAGPLPVPGGPGPAVRPRPPPGPAGRGGSHRPAAGRRRTADSVRRQLPFTLTAGQGAVGKTLAEELSQDSPVNWLLQGEVGSGKTIVALRAMLQAVDAGGQAAPLAPTEVLAAQHYESIRRTLGPLSRDGLLGGQVPTPSR